MPQSRHLDPKLNNFNDFCIAFFEEPGQISDTFIESAAVATLGKDVCGQLGREDL
jgi:hypothetical protein